MVKNSRAKYTIKKRTNHKVITYKKQKTNGTRKEIQNHDRNMYGVRLKKRLIISRNYVWT